MKTWTASLVRDELPEVEVCTPLGTIVQCVVSGRKCEFATVRVKDDPYPSNPGWSFSWEAIARSLNSVPNKPLQV